MKSPTLHPSAALNSVAQWGQSKVRVPFKGVYPLVSLNRHEHAGERNLGAYDFKIDPTRGECPVELLPKGESRRQGGC